MEEIDIGNSPSNELTMNFKECRDSQMSSSFGMSKSMTFTF